MAAPYIPTTASRQMEHRKFPDVPEPSDTQRLLADDWQFDNETTSSKSTKMEKVDVERITQLNSIDPSVPYFADEIADYYWPPDASPVSERDKTETQGLLHNSAFSPGELAYVILYHKANPLWVTEKLIVANSNLHLLPTGAEGSDFGVLPARREESAERHGASTKQDSNPDIASHRRTQAKEALGPDRGLKKIVSKTPWSSPTLVGICDAASPPASPSVKRTRQMTKLMQMQPGGKEPKLISVFVQKPNTRADGRSFTFAGFYYISCVRHLDPERADEQRTRGREKIRQPTLPQEGPSTAHPPIPQGTITTPTPHSNPLASPPTTPSQQPSAPAPAPATVADHWAEIHFEPIVDDAGKPLGLSPPCIERHIGPLPLVPPKSVNELLSELRREEVARVRGEVGLLGDGDGDEAYVAERWIERD